MVQVFLSHNSLDKPFVRLLGEDLEAAGVFVWFDEAKLKIGDSLPLEISRAISNTDYVLAFLSHNSIKSRWVEKEIAIASSLEINGEQIKVLPVRLDDSKVPALLVDKVHADLTGPGRYDAGFRKVLKAILPEALPKSEDSFYCLTIGQTRKDRLVRASQDPQMKDWVVDYLSHTPRKRPTERYYVYQALGEIGGAVALEALKKGLSDPNHFAQMGAKQALELLKR